MLVPVPMITTMIMIVTMFMLMVMTMLMLMIGLMIKIVIMITTIALRRRDVTRLEKQTGNSMQSLFYSPSSNVWL